MKKLSSILVALLILLCSSCFFKQEKAFYAKPIEVDAKKVEDLIKNGKALATLETNCYICHDPNSKSHDDMLAPPLVGIKYNYKKKFPQKTEFIYAMTNFIANPDKKNALMKGPVWRFGLMPKSPLSGEELQAVVTYLHDNDVAEPTWFSEHFEKEQGQKWKGQFH